MSPADEVAEEVCYSDEVEQDKGNIHVEPPQIHRVKGLYRFFLGGGRRGGGGQLSTFISHTFSAMSLHA